MFIPLWILIPLALIVLGILVSPARRQVAVFYDEDNIYDIPEDALPPEPSALERWFSRLVDYAFGVVPAVGLWFLFSGFDLSIRLPLSVFPGLVIYEIRREW